MKSLLRIFLFGALVVGGLLGAAPASAQADDYWDGHWHWYDNSYRPYYYNNHLYGRQYGYYGPYQPGPYYGGPGYSRYRGNYGYRGNTDLGNYYGTPNAGYRDRPERGGAASVGPLRFGWR